MAPPEQDRDLAAVLTRAAGEVGVPGAVLAVQRDGRRTVVPTGVLHRGTGLEVTASSAFQIGSISKSWTATMVVQLLGEGRLALDQPVGELVPGLPVAGADEITVRQLLTHTSGIDGDVFTDTGPGWDCLERYVAGLGSVEQVFPPGAAYSYCNTGYVLLGRVVEVLDGRPWEHSLRARLVEPLGLRATTVRAEEAILGRTAVGHRVDGTPVTAWQLPQSIAPAGLICQPAEDLLDYVTALHLDPAPALATMQQHHHDIGPSGAGPSGDGASGVGLGWRRYRLGGHDLFGHDGSTVGQQAFLRVAPAAGVVVVLLTNGSRGGALWDLVAPVVLEQELGVGLPDPPAPVEVSLDDRHVGRYERAGVRLDVTRREGGLALRYAATGASLAFSDEPEQHYELRPVDGSGDRFVARQRPDDPWTPMSFGRLPDGRGYHFGGRITPRVDGPSAAGSGAGLSPARSPGR